MKGRRLFASEWREKSELVYHQMGLGAFLKEWDLHDIFGSSAGYWRFSRTAWPAYVFRMGRPLA